MSAGDVFRQGVLEMSTSPVAAAERTAAWGDLLTNRIAVGLSVILMLMLLKDMIKLAPSLLFSLDRARGSVSLEHNVSLARMRNSVALAFVLPFSLLLDRFAVYRPDFWAGIPPMWSAAATLGTVLCYALLRRVMHAAIRPKRLSQTARSACLKCAYDFFIAMSIVSLVAVGALSVAGVGDEVIRVVILLIITSFFLFFMIREGQILNSICSHFSTFLYLCGLEIPPAAAVVASAVLF